MPTTYPNLGLTLPVRGAPGSGLWDDTLDADLALLDAHDHSSGKGLRITPAAMNINADLPFSSLYAPTQLHRVQFSAIAGGALTNANNLSLFVSDGTGGLAANELYYRTSAGNHVRIINGSSLNVAAFVGGIVGDYQSTGAQLAYDDGGKRYTFKEGTGDSNNWARVWAGGLRLAEFNTNESVYIEQVVPAALAGSYSMTWPLALPAGARLVQVDNTGQIAFTSAFAGTLDLTGATLTLARTWQHHIGNVLLAAGGATLVNGNGGTPSASRVLLSTDTGINVLPLILPVGTLTAYSVSINKSSATGTITVKLWEGASAASPGTTTQIGSTQSNGANNPGNITLGQSGLSFTMTAGREYWIEVVGGGTTGDLVFAYSATV